MAGSHNRRRRSEDAQGKARPEAIFRPDLFVVGYGLDFADRYRNLPFVGVLRPELYRESGGGQATKTVDPAGVAT